MHGIRDRRARPQTSARVSVVKWQQPAEELVSTARIVQALIERKRCGASDIRLTVPSASWAVQLEHACSQVNVPTACMMPQTRLSHRAQQSLALLRVLAQPDDTARYDAACSLGLREAQLASCLDDYGSAHALTLTRVLGMREQAEFAHALRQMRGDEDAAHLLALVEEQMREPSLPPGSSDVPIVHLMRNTALAQHPADYVFVLACVDGLLPAYAPRKQQESASCEDTGQEETHEAYEAFSNAISCARKQVLISYFDRIREDRAKAARISFARTRLENGTRVAMTRPTPFLSAWGAQRPSTESGQALLRSYGLN